LEGGRGKANPQFLKEIQGVGEGVVGGNPKLIYY